MVDSRPLRAFANKIGTVYNTNTRMRYNKKCNIWQYIYVTNSIF